MKTKKQEIENTDQKIIKATLPMITKLNGKDFLFFNVQDNSTESFAVQCPDGTFEALGKQLKDNLIE